MRKLTLLILCLWIAGYSQAQGQALYFTGQSSNWDDPENWTPNPGEIAGNSIPDSNTDVIISPDLLDREIFIDANFSCRNLLITEGEIRFSSSKNSSLSVHGNYLSLGSINWSGFDGAFILKKSQNETKVLVSDDQWPKNTKWERDNNFTVSDFSANNISNSKSANCPAFTIVSNSTGPTCNGFNNGVASIIPPTDGVGPYMYQWVGGPTTPTWAGRPAGTYTIIVWDMGQGGVPCSADIFINEPAPLALFTLNGTPPDCPEVCNGSAMPVVIGGNGGYTYSWSSGETGFNPVALCASFTLTITDSQGCVLDSNVTFLNAPQPFEFNPSITPIYCTGSNDGLIDLNTTGGSPPLSFSWAGPGSFSSSDEDISNLSPGTYTVTITDNNNCVADTSIVIEEFPPIEVDFSIVHNLCAGGLEGEIITSVTGGTPPYSYNWTGPDGFTSVEESLSGVSAGIYDLEITDANGCPFNISAEVLEGDPIEVELTSQDLLCFEDGTGSISASVSGGTPPYAYEWTGPDGFSASTEDISGLSAGIYFLSVTDANGCSPLLPFEAEVVQPGQFDILVEQTPITCNGEDDATIFLTINGATPPYAVSWSGPGGFNSTDEDIIDLAPGIYTASINDFNNCDTILVVEIESPPVLTVDAAITNSLCENSNDGAIEITISGGTDPYIVSWSGPDGFSADVEDISGLFPGSYSVEIEDAGDCIFVADFVVGSPDAITLEFDLIHNLCFGESGGEIDVTVSGGTAPYNFTWVGENGFSSSLEDIDQLEAGIYNLEVEDANGCIFSGSAEILTPDILLPTASVESPLCEGDFGAITLTLEGGTPDYSIEWSGPGAIGGDDYLLTDLIPGLYSATITDANGCDTILEVVVDEPVALIISGQVNNPLCSGDLTGSIDISVESGNEPFEFQWTGPEGFESIEEDLNSLAPGNYEVTVTDINGCFSTASFLIEPPLPLSADISVVDNICFGEEAGEITVTISGGTPPYLISWTGPDGFTSEAGFISGLANGEYILTITDANGCTGEFSVSVNSPEELVADALVQPAICSGEDNGTIELTITGGTPNYEIQWNGPEGFSSSEEDLTGLAPGVYEGIITDSEGCVVTLEVMVGEPELLLIEATLTQPLCAGISDGSISIEIEGGIPPYNITWSGPDGFSSNQEIIEGLASGVYEVFVSDNSGCSAQESIVLENNIEIVITENISHASCGGAEDGAIEINIEGGIEPYVVSWVGPDGFISDVEDLDNLAPGIYSILVTDQNGCEIEESYSVNSPGEYVIDYSVTPVSCAGESNGEIDVTISGGSLIYTLSWTGPDGFSSSEEDIVGLQGGIYTLVLTEDSGCMVTQEINVPEPDSVSLQFNINSPSCEQADGIIVALPGGGIAPYTVQWTDEEGNVLSNDPELINIPAGVYIATVTDANACVTDSLLEITEEVIEVSAEVGSNSCHDANDGTIELEISGGTAPFVISWIGPDGFVSDQPTLSGLQAGEYTVTIDDAAGCSFSDTYTIVNPDILTIDFDLENISCFNANDGALTANISGGTTPYNLSWTGPNDFSGNEDIIENLLPGLYNLTVVDENGCVASEEILLEQPDELSISLTGLDVLCAGDFTGAINTSITGGTPPFNLEWTGPDNFSSDETSLVDIGAGIYSVSLTDANGCETFADIIISESLPLGAEVTTVNSSCQEANGSASAVISGGTISSEYQISWEDQEGNIISVTSSISNVPAGIYTLSVVDDNDCELLLPVTISDEGATISFEIDSISCFGGSDGGLIAFIDGGEEPYTYSWIGPDNFTANTDTIQDLFAGIYAVAITDAIGCIYADTVLLEEPTPIEVSGIVTTVSCAGNDGSISLIVTGGTPEYWFSWTGPDGFIADQQVITGLATGDYSVTVQDQNSCLTFENFTVEESLPLIVDGNVEEPACHDSADGFIQLTVAGGNGNYGFSWSGPDGFTADMQNIADLAAGIYQVVVEDMAGCQVTQEFELLAPDPVVVSVTVIQPDCEEQNGELIAHASGGTGNYTYWWEDQDGIVLSNVAELNGIGIGEYHLNVSDMNGCAVDTVIQLFNTGAEITAEIVDALCFAGASGSIDPELTGGTAPFFYSWTGVDGFTSNEEIISGLVAGDYDLTVEDATGCVFFQSFTVGEPEEIAITGNIIPIGCQSGFPGEINVSSSGGTGNISYSWTGPDPLVSEGDTVEIFIPGIYTVTATDENGCIAITDFEIEQGAQIDISLTLTSPSCFNENNGGIDLIIGGGEMPYEVLWTGPDGFSSAETELDSLFAGTYNLIVTDAANCILDSVIVLTQPEILDAEITATSPICPDEPNSGSLIVEFFGGSAPYTAFWTGPEGTFEGDSIYGVSPGIYQLLVTDSNGCTFEATDSILKPEDFLFEIGIQQITCSGADDGAIKGNIVGGTDPLIYSWTGPDGFTSDNALIFGLAEGDYTLLVTDANGCEADSTVTIIAPEPLHISILETSDAQCINDTTGFASISVSGGTAPYQVAWTGPMGFTSDTEVIDNLLPGLYQVETTDANGCIASEEITISYIFEVIANAGNDLSICFSEDPIEISGTSLNGNEFTWTTEDGEVLSEGEDLIIDLDTGLHVLIFTAGNGLCHSSDTIEITILELPEVDAGETQEVLPDQEFILGGNPTSPTGIRYDWEPDHFLNDSSLANPTGVIDQTTRFSVLVYDTNGCFNIDTVLIVFVPEINPTSGITPNGDGKNDEWIIDGIEQFPNNVVSIFNRWGDVLYQTNGYNRDKAWNGLYKNKPLPVGTYYYAIELNDPRYPDPITGPISIYR